LPNIDAIEWKNENKKYQNLLSNGPETSKLFDKADHCERGKKVKMKKAASPTR
jgi:hypothetical protein